MDGTSSTPPSAAYLPFRKVHEYVDRLYNPESSSTQRCEDS